MFTNIKFQTRIFLSFLVLIIAIVIIFGIYFNMYIFKIVEDGVNENIFQLSSKVSQQIDTYIKANNHALIKMITNKNLLIAIKEINRNPKRIENDELLVYDRLFSDIVFDAINLSINPSNIYIYSYDMSYTYSYGVNSSSASFKAIINEEYRKKLIENKIITYANSSNSYKESFTIIREISDIFNNINGYIEVQQSYSTLDSICNIGDLGTVTIIDYYNNVIYPVNKVDAEDINLYLDKEKEGKYGTFKDESNNYCSYYQSDYLGWTIYIKYFKNPLLRPLYAMQAATIAVIIIIILFSLLFLFFASKNLVLPIRRLRNSIVNINNKNMSLNIHEKSYNNEINLLNDGFQAVLDRLKESMEMEIKANNAESNSRFLALQAHIAPHFIHNILYIISISAQENKSGVVVEMCKQLSDMLRYIISSPFSSVAIINEVQHVSNYLSLMKRKYEDFLNYSIEVQDEIKNITVPKLTIQPFVENCIQHGFKDMDPPWEISIICKLEEEFWVVEIKDNGSGFKEEKLIDINKQLISCKSPLQMQPEDEIGMIGMGMGNMGIINTVRRLRLMCGDSFEFSISNNCEGGSMIRIKGLFKRDNKT